MHFLKQDLKLEDMYKINAVMYCCRSMLIIQQKVLKRNCKYITSTF